VSTSGQSLEIQIEKLKAYGCEKIFTEKKSGANKQDRAALNEALTFIREADELVVTRLDRLARSVRDLTNITSDLQTKQVSFVVLDQKIDTTTPTGKLLFHVLSAIGEFERELINERIRDGIVKAKNAGVKF
jgi:DNA invertase Pin-like site-specific DNA recombinase